MSLNPYEPPAIKSDVRDRAELNLTSSWWRMDFADFADRCARWGIGITLEYFPAVIGLHLINFLWLMRPGSWIMLWNVTTIGSYVGMVVTGGIALLGAIWARNWWTAGLGLIAFVLGRVGLVLWFSGLVLFIWFKF